MPGYSFVQQVASPGSASAVQNLSNPQANITQHNFLIAAAVCNLANVSELTIAGTTDAWEYAGYCSNGSSEALAIYTARNAVGGECTYELESPGTDLLSTAIWEYSGIATSGPLLGVGAASNINGGGSAGPNTLVCGSISVPAATSMLFVVAYDFSAVGHAPPSAGTSPIALNGHTPIWAGNNSGGALGTLVAADARILTAGTYTPTFGTTSTNNNCYDSMGMFALAVDETGTVVPVTAAPNFMLMFP